MRSITEFLRLRRRDDNIKLALLMCIIAVVFLVKCIYSAAFYGVNVSKNAEYVLCAQTESAHLPSAIDKLCAMDGAVSASFLREYYIDVESNSVKVTKLSAEYLQKCYGIEADGQRRIWVSEKIFQALDGGEKGSVRLTYTDEEGTKSGEFIPCSFVEEAVTCGTSASVGKSDLAVVMFDGRDITDKRSSELSALGFAAVNSEHLVAEAYEQQLMLSDVGYSFVISALCIACAVLFFKLSNKKGHI